MKGPSRLRLGRIGIATALAVVIGALVPSMSASISATAATDGQMVYPASGNIQSKVGDGCRGNYRAHEGIDISAAGGTPILAAYSGVIKSRTVNSGYGNYTDVEHPGGYVTRYAHMASPGTYAPGTRVERGQQIGIVGNTGNSPAYHLHFEVRRNGAVYTGINDGFVCLTNVARGGTIPLTFPGLRTESGPPIPPADFTGDGRSDLLNHDDASSDAERVHGRRNRVCEHVELRIHLDAQRLEHALGRVTGALRRCGRRRDQDLDELAGARDRLLLTRVDDEAGVAAGELLLAVAFEDAAEVALAVGGDHVSGGDTLRLIHPHVERGVLRIREPALGLVELQGRDAEIEQDPRSALRVQPDLVVHRVHESDAITEASEPLPRDAQRVGVAVESDQTDVREAFEQCLGVASHAEGGIDEHRSVRLEGGSEQLDTAVEQDGGVYVSEVHDLSRGDLRL